MVALSVDVKVRIDFAFGIVCQRFGGVESQDHVVSSSNLAHESQTGVGDKDGYLELDEIVAWIDVDRHSTVVEVNAITGYVQRLVKVGHISSTLLRTILEP